MLLDTSGLMAMLNASDKHHEKAKNLFHAGRDLVTHNLIVTELVALAETRGVNRIKVLEVIDELLMNPTVVVTWVSISETNEALALLAKRLDKTYSLCDAVSFVLMRRFGLIEALTTDRHFEQEGFVRLLRPIT